MTGTPHGHSLAQSTLEVDLAVLLPRSELEAMVIVAGAVLLLPNDKVDNVVSAPAGAELVSL